MVGMCAAQDPGRPNGAANRKGPPAEFRTPEDRMGKLKSGDPAMDFTLKLRHSEKTVTLSSFKNKAPVALVLSLIHI